MIYLTVKKFFRLLFVKIFNKKQTKKNCVSDRTCFAPDAADPSLLTKPGPMRRRGPQNPRLGAGDPRLRSHPKEFKSSRAA